MPNEREYTAGFDREDIQLSLISPWEKFIANAKWKFDCLVGVAYFPVSALWKKILTIPMDKKLNQLK